MAEADPPPPVRGFANYAVVSFHCLAIYFEKSHREALDFLSEMPQILAKIGLEEVGLPDHSTLVRAFDRFQMKVWRVLLRFSAQLRHRRSRRQYATFFDRETAGKYYCRRTNYCVQTLKTTPPVDTKTQAVFVHCTTGKRHDTRICWQLARRNVGEIANPAADNDYD